jgi:hypothetical protein
MLPRPQKRRGARGGYNRRMMARYAIADVVSRDTHAKRGIRDGLG